MSAPEFVRRVGPRRITGGPWTPEEIIAGKHLAARALSPAEAATVARFDAAPDAVESLRLQIAYRFPRDDANWQETLQAADAAIAVLRGDDA